MKVSNVPVLEILGKDGARVIPIDGNKLVVDEGDEDPREFKIEGFYHILNHPLLFSPDVRTHRGCYVLDEHLNLDELAGENLFAHVGKDEHDEGLEGVLIDAEESGSG